MSGSSKGTRTRHQSGSRLAEYVGPGKELIPSEVPTLRAVICQGILIKEKLFLEQGTAKTDIHLKDIVAQLVPLIADQWRKSNAKFRPPVIIQERSIGAKVERLWGRVEEVVRGRAKKAEKEKVEQLLDRLLDITTCSHTILLCTEPGSECKEGKSCKTKAHIKCDCPRESKVPVIELQWLAAQRAKIGEKSSFIMTTNDKVETEKQKKAEKRKAEQYKAEEKRKKKVEEEEQLVKETEKEFFAELGCETEEVVELDEEVFSAPISLVKEQEEEVMRVVDDLLEERLGEVALAVVRYLGRPAPRRNTMRVANTASASLR
jgi:hypothetical protein